MAQSHFIIAKVGLAEPELFRSFIRERVMEFEESIDSCYSCDGGHLCAKHTDMIDEAHADAYALAMGMVKITLE